MFVVVTELETARFEKGWDIFDELILLRVLAKMRVEERIPVVMFEALMPVVTFEPLMFPRVLP